MWPILYTAELDYPLSDLDEFIDWYAFRHAPDLFRAGFQTCTCYRAVEGGMGLIDFYEAPNWEIFNTTQYREMGPRDRYCTRILHKRLDKTHTVYAQKHIMPGATTEAAPSLDADWISLARFSATPATERGIVDWLKKDEGARLLGLGATRVRIASRTVDHPIYTTHRPRCLLLTEWPDKPPPQACLLAQLTSTFGGTVSDLDAFVGCRLYPWTDEPMSGTRP